MPLLFHRSRTEYRIVVIYLRPSPCAPYCDTILNHPFGDSPLMATLAEPSPAIGAVTHGKNGKIAGVG
jgi:hypothetical protein